MPADGTEPRGRVSVRAASSHDAWLPVVGRTKVRPTLRRSQMRLSALVLAAATFLSAAAGWRPFTAAAADERGVVVAESRFAVTNAPDQAEVVQLVVDFPPGAST